jgi:hypothetical protein
MERIETLDAFFTHIASSIMLVTGPASVELVMRAITLQFQDDGTLVFAVGAQWEQASMHAQRAFTKYKGAVLRARIEFDSPVQLVPHYTHITMGNIMLVPKTVEFGLKCLGITLLGQPDAKRPATHPPIDFINAVHAGNPGIIRNLVEFGSDINLQVGRTHAALQIIRHSLPGDPIRDWLMKRPDLDWNMQIFDCGNYAPLIQHVINSTHSLENLPWSRIDLHARDSFGENALHSHISGHDGDSSAAGLLLQHGSGTLALELTNNLRRPSEIPSLQLFSRAALASTLQSVERETLTAVTKRLSCHIAIPDVVNLIAGYFTTFSLSLKRKL